MTVQLSVREPRFRADRGFYGKREDGRPYFAVNMVQYRLLTRSMATTPKIATLTLKVCYVDDKRAVCAHYDVCVRARLGESGTFNALDSMSLHPTKNQVVELGRRVFAPPHAGVDIGNGTTPTTRARVLPTLMFTPRVFSDVCEPDAHVCFLSTSTRRLVRAIWAALRHQATADWALYSGLHTKFCNEYYTTLSRAFDPRRDARDMSPIRHEVVLQAV